MLVAEIRKILKNYESNDLIEIAIELYKAVPKSKREDRDIDALIKDLKEYKKKGKFDKSQFENIDISKLKQQIELFIEYAYEQYYFAPNRYVPKKERPKWRFIVKTYIKKLQSISINHKDSKIATDLLIEIYKMLNYACGYYLFNTDNPFRSVGIVQTHLLDTVISRILGEGISESSLKTAIELTVKGYVDRETLHEELNITLVSNIKTPDSRIMALQQCKVIREKLCQSRKALKRGESDYKIEEEINNLANIEFRINASLCEYDTAIKNFKKHYSTYDKEILLYILLGLLMEYNLMKHWILEYNDALTKGIDPRKTLVNTYNYILKNNKLPESFIWDERYITEEES
jgi:hypothetical protein